MDGNKSMEKCDYIREHILSHNEVIEQIINDEHYVDEIGIISEMIIDCFDRGGKVLICGNGGSAADAQHIAAELVVRFETNRRALPAIALNANTSSLTAIANDLSAEKIYERQVEAFGTKGDVLLAISTSGNSENVYLAIEKARQQGMRVIAFLGKNGGKCRGLSDAEIIVPSSLTSCIQEIHIMIAHIICGIVDKHYE